MTIIFGIVENRQNPDIVDEGLAEDILRDSCDPGAVGVIAAGGKLPFSRSANEMLGKFGVREMVILNRKACCPS